MTSDRNPHDAAPKTKGAGIMNTSFPVKVENGRRCGASVCRELTSPALVAKRAPPGLQATRLRPLPGDGSVCGLGGSGKKLEKAKRPARPLEVGGKVRIGVNEEGGYREEWALR